MAFRMAIESERLDSLFFDSCFLTGKGTQVVQFSTTYFTDFVNRDAFDKRRFDRENSLYTYVLRHLTNCETFFVAVTGDTDNNTAILLDTLFVTLFDTVSYRDRITTEGSSFFVANASSAILIKSIVYSFLIVIYNETQFNGLHFPTEIT